MLTPRNIIAVVILIAIVSITWSVIGLLQPPDSDGLRGDSYGTRFHGYRAVFETLDELDVRVDRLLQPPAPSDLDDSVLVVWNPHEQLVASEPSWLNELTPRIQSGGHVVIADDDAELIPEKVREAMEKSSVDGPMIANPDQSAIELVGLNGVSITADNVSPNLPTREDSLEDLISGVLSAGARSDVPRLNYAIRGTGQFESAGELIESIEIATGELNVVDTGDAPAESAIYAIDAAGMEHCIAARIPVGEGSVTVSSTPWILRNGAIGQADNVLLVTLLILQDDRRVVFDEFYHGLAMRGNPMWLFSQRTYGTVVLALLALSGIIVWRNAVFLGPPLAPESTSRRSVREYIDAMARFMCESKYHDQWLLSSVRDGVLWHLRQEHGLPPEQHNVEELLAIMFRRDPEGAATVRRSLDEIDTAIHNDVRPGHNSVIQLLQRMTACLSRNSTGQSATKSAR